MNEFDQKVVEEIAKQVPLKEIYNDVAKPTLSSTGKLVELIPRAISCALEPLHQWILHKEYNIEQTKKILESKLMNYPPEEIIPPEPHIAVPAIQSLSYCKDNDELREMYANLLASSMLKKHSKFVHPSYVEIIKQISPDEARILKFFSNELYYPIIWLNSHNGKGLQKIILIRNFTTFSEEIECDIPEHVPIYVDNLERLKLFKVYQDKSFSDVSNYDRLLNHKTIIERKSVPLEQGREYGVDKGLIELTVLGKGFSNICIGG